MGKLGSGKLRTALWIAAATVAYAAAAGMQAVRKPLGLDEISTFYVARLPTWAVVWEALKDGVDQSLPMLFLVTRASTRLFGWSSLALRLPQLAGFWFLCLCLFWFARRRVAAPFALAFMIFPVASGAYFYAYEARSYGLVLGFAGLALVSWQAAAEGRVRRLALAGIVVGLAGALLSNYYAVLLALPFAAGEAWRSIRMRKIDWPVWIAFLFSAAPLVIYPVLLAPTRLWVTRSFAPGLADVSGCYISLLQPALPPILASVLVLLILRRGDREPCAFPGHEIMSFLGFLSIPVASIAIGMATHTFWEFRYALPAVIGIAGLLVAAAGRGSRRAGWLIFFIFAGKCAVENRSLLERVPAGYSHLLETAAQSGQEIVVASVHDFMKLSFYERPELLSRTHYLLDRDAMLRIENSDLRYNMAVRFRKWFPLRARVDDAAPFLSRRPRFLLYGNGSEWLTRYMLERGAALRLIGEEGVGREERLLLQVDLGGPPDK